MSSHACEDEQSETKLRRLYLHEVDSNYDLYNNIIYQIHIAQAFSNNQARTHRLYGWSDP